MPQSSTLLGSPGDDEAPHNEEAASAQAAFGVVRLVSSDVENSLERVGDPALIAAGKVTLISLEAIMARLGARWGSRKDQVYAFAERVLQRGVGASGVYLRVSEIDFLIVHPDLNHLAGQAASLGYLREVLSHFLGDASLANSGVLTVTRLGKDGLDAAPLDARAVDAEAGSDDGADEPVVAAPDRPAPAHQQSSFVSSDGRELRVSATLEPVYELKGFTRIGFRMNRRVIAVRTGEELSALQIAALSSGDALRVDLATITRGIDRLGADAGVAQQPSLIVPFSFASVSSRGGRGELMAPLKQAGALVKLGVICEVLDIEGVPPSVLLTATSLMRPFSLLVVGRVRIATEPAIRRLVGGGLQALSFECPPDLSDADFRAWAERAIVAARRVAKSIIVYRAGSVARASILASLGASHVSLAPK